MKKLIYKLAGLLGGIALVLFSYFSQPSAEINNNSNQVSYAIPDTQFQVGIINGGQYFGYTYIHDSLNFNTWHRYTRPIGGGWDGNQNDRYDYPISGYQATVTNRINENSNTYKMRTYMNRPIIDYIVSGQRIDYQCENVPTNQYYWFWAYNNSFSDGNSIYDTEDHSQYGTGETVKYCMRDNNNPGSNACWIDSGLKANRELSFTQTLDYMADTAWDWSVMPRIRIDSAYAAGTAHNEDTVCRIKITGWKGEVVKDIGLLVENFKQSFQGTYHGNYLDTFHFYTGQDSLFLFKNSITQYFLPPDKGYCFNWGNDTCKMDIKIYWSGKCDTWFDRVRVENEPAHQYLTKKDSILTSKINSEVDWSMQNYNGIPNYFYYEEEQFSHFSAIKELNRQIMERSQNRNSLIIYLNYGLFKAHVPNCWETLWNANDKKVFGTDKMQGIKISI